MSRSSLGGSASASVAKTARACSNAASKEMSSFLRDTIDELVERHAARLAAHVRLAALERLAQRARQRGLHVLDLAGREPLGERPEDGIGGPLGLDAVQVRPASHAVQELANIRTSGWARVMISAATSPMSGSNSCGSSSTRSSIS